MNTLYIKDGKVLPKNRITLYVNIDGEEMQVISPSHEMLLEEGWVVYEKAPLSIEQIKLNKISQVDMHDKSAEVNSFILNGDSVWLNKADRVGLMNSINIEKSAGREVSNLWFNGIKLDVECDTAIQLLASLELYALDCYNVTASHKANIQALNSIEDINLYDYTIGYPEKLKINI